MAKVSEQISKGFQGLPPWGKGVVAVVGIVAAGYAVVKIFGLLGGNTSQERQEALDVESELDKEITRTGLTYGRSNYASFANTIETAGFDIGTDEDAIYSVFRKLKNNADYLALTSAWGKPNRKVYEWGIGRNMTLAQFLRYEMNEKEISKINFILQSKNIKYRV